uniref:Fucolectin tachylectin-4 pentraxin-1 domain-containing protein n=1 Tax=Pundamilia nyererei TaxID=303518 RepID=A0A3B4GZX5_9CICH
VSSVEPLQNVALNRETVQSSVIAAYGPSKGVDGCRNGNLDSGCCTHTLEDLDPWWRVDLLAVYKVSAVTIINRQDAVIERILGGKILIGNSLDQNGNQNPSCGMIESLDGTPTYTFQCNAMEGRYVNVIIPGIKRYMTLCEVEVFASLSGRNQAQGGAAISVQSSTSGTVGTAGKAVDGNRDANYQSGSCTLTTVESDPWWRVDLVNVYTIGTVMITNRQELENGLDGAEIWIGNSTAISDPESIRCAVISHIPSGQAFYFPCNSVKGRYVTVFLPGSAKVLSLCEVEVYYGKYLQFFT